MSDNATVKTVEHGEASRLPDPNWKWRRLLIFEICTTILVLMGWVIVRKLGVDPSAEPFVRYSFYTLWGALTLYGVGATLTDVAKLVAAVHTTRKETISSAPPPATVTDGRAEMASDGELPADQRVRL